MLKVCFTGHRPNKIGGYNSSAPIRQYISQQLAKVCYDLYEKNKDVSFMTGMAQGVDQDAALVVLEIIKESQDPRGPGGQVELHAAIPMVGQSTPWGVKAKKEYDKILAQLSKDHIHFVHDCKPKDKWEACKFLDDRNRYMVDRSDMVIAVWDGTSGGTANCVEYAKSRGKRILIIPPRENGSSYLIKEREIEDTPVIPEKKYEKILHCSSAGDKRFSALYAKVTVFNREDSIENHYQRSKLPYGVKKGEKVSGMTINGKTLDAKYLTPWYNALWVKYLDVHPDIVEYAKEFDEFIDIFKGKSINCQADVIKRYVKEGRESIIKDPLFIELMGILRSK